MDAYHSYAPADEAAEEATRAVQTSLDRRDNGWPPTPPPPTTPSD